VEEMKTVAASKTSRSAVTLKKALRSKALLGTHSDIVSEIKEAPEKSAANKSAELL
jgi:predicted solute-binding protein